MAWSDAARRAALLARRLKRVQDYNPSVARRYERMDRQRFMEAKIGMRLKRVSHYSRSNVEQKVSSFRHMLAIEKGGAYAYPYRRKR